MNKALIPTILSTLVLAIILVASARAQEEGTGGIKPSPAANPGPRRESKGTAKTFRPVYSSMKAQPTITTGALSVVAAPGAVVYLEPVGGKQGKSDLKGNLKEKRQFIFNALKPGDYIVSVELEGYEDPGHPKGEQKVTIVAGRTEPVDFNLRPITHKVTIKTNVKTGELKYAAPGEQPRVLYFSNGLAALPPLPKGKYQIEISTDEPGYPLLKDAIEVGPDKPTSFEANLKRRVSEAMLSPPWTRAELKEWGAPAQWGVLQDKLLVKGKGMALPANENYRHYVDFEIVSDVQMMNDKGVAFILRAQDRQNYYLVQLTGGASEERYLLRGFVVKNNVPRPLGSPITISGYRESITGKSFELNIKVVGNKISVYLNDTQSGDNYPLAESLVDYDRHFSSGAPGIAALDQEENHIGRFVVSPIKAGARP